MRCSFQVACGLNRVALQDAQANALAVLSFQTRHNGGQSVLVCRPASCSVNSATPIVYQIWHVFLVPFTFPMAFVGFAWGRARPGMVGLAVVTDLPPPLFRQRGAGPDSWAEGSGRHRSGGVHVHRVATLVVRPHACGAVARRCTGRQRLCGRPRRDFPHAAFGLF